MYVASASPVCQRISSVYVCRATLDTSAGFGWVVGAWKCGATTDFSQNPTLFRWGKDVNGGTRCKVWSDKHPAAGQYSSFRVGNLNDDGKWASFHEGTRHHLTTRCPWALQPGSQYCRDGKTLPGFGDAHWRTSKNIILLTGRPIERI